MGFITWSNVSGKIYVVILFLIISVVIFLIVMKVIPEMEFLSNILKRFEGL